MTLHTLSAMQELVFTYEGVFERRSRCISAICKMAAFTTLLLMIVNDVRFGESC